MKLVNNRPLIEASDYPLTVVNAFQEPNWYDSLYDGDKNHLEHRSHNAWETLEYCFAISQADGSMYRPDGEALILDFSIDYLEFALVSYGYRLLSEGTDGADSEVGRIDQLLSRIDIVKGIRTVVKD